MTLSQRFFGAVKRRGLSLFRGEVPAELPLEMIYPVSPDTPRLEIDVHCDYSLRQWRPEDQANYFHLIEAAGLPRFAMDYWEDRLLAGGFFVVEHNGTRELAATCMAAHRPSSRHPRGGALGWLAASPDHSGRGLGRAVSAAVTQRLVDAGYQRIYLETHDHRLPALKIYLALGWQPVLYHPEMVARWRRICEKLDWAFTPNEWATLD